MVDPASNWPLFAEKARDLLSKEKVAAVFGCWTSVSRKSVLPVFEELNGLFSTQSNTKGRRVPATFFILEPRPINRRYLPSNT